MASFSKSRSLFWIDLFYGVMAEREELHCGAQTADFQKYSLFIASATGVTSGIAWALYLRVSWAVFTADLTIWLCKLNFCLEYLLLLCM